MYPTALDPLTMFELADDFLYLDTVKWASVDDSATGTNTADSVSGGQASIVTAGADNDYHIMVSRSKPFNFAKDHAISLVARFSLTEANTDDANFVIGLSSDLASTLLGADGAGPPSSYTGALFFKVDGTMAIQFETSNGSAQTTTASALTFVSGRTYQVGFDVNAGDSTADVTWWILDESANTRTVASRPHKVPLASAAAMGLAYGVKAGGANAETLKIDYIRCCQRR